ncbi:hypothetical protein M430DRAFT_65476 [Amorphotheca resinae ATCC 22711]|uniref:Uncharacterized protein n=1 Tax=Amorphotheca resinae ATCC 22711 TaxID=857342 RepID=A0A2T3B6A5_AMORE|nr:hypothetical protein M430DRAFT_65476 [Amorphotheca resinae ATCC 22711]PSS22282.1 hypothetical protein M430DRAFT_65476 [Amorphotheca resinae ATCC 22711]
MSGSNVLRLATRRCIRPRQHCSPSLTRPIRPFSQSSLGSYPRKDSQDKDSINTESTEYSKSGTDDATARQDTAFDPTKTDPEEQKNSGKGDENSGNPLDVSPANQEVSKARDQQEGAPENDPNQGKKSVARSPKKAKKLF